jgi:hypothetical protein
MFLRLTIMALGIALASCADLPNAAPDLQPLAGSREPASDWAMPGLAIGQVSGACPFPFNDPPECEGPDPIDDWAVTPRSDGSHCFYLVWAPGVCPPQSALCSDLDLVLRDPEGQLLERSANDTADGETICTPLSANAKYFVSVVAFDTHGVSQNYILQVEPTD